MKRTAFTKAAISSLIVGTTMVGCTGAAFRPSAIAPQRENSADRLAIATQKALADHDTGRAIAAAEAAVQTAPRDVGYRQLLGRAYMAAGRFASAETALTDAMTLGSKDASTIVSLALVQAALGKNEAARQLLGANADNVPAGDYGLAMAMAGDPDEGVRILSEMIHDPSATARTRQNLAYAYALAGRWKDARVMAGFDLEPLAANQRVAQWAQTAAPGAAPQRVAALMGVTIDAADAGQPVALALAPETAPVQMAQAAPVEEVSSPPATEASPAEMAAVEPIAAPAPVIQALSAPVSEAVRIAAPRPAATLRRSAAPVGAHQVAFRPAGKGNSHWVVQLGAYDNNAIAKEKWYAMARSNSMIASLPVVTSQITVNGATYARLALSGFDDRAEAVALCRAIKTRRGQCFVRENAPDAAPQRWALTARPRQLASR
ncbi:SPOR domain-containing protein [Sphingobium bisphenolivorans]|uniref:SPOR domain-containing protein n=1 Tax=Sphingobium bisphenolivorans TaxID=1335760 RepID=UPI00039D43D8|nr:SPOR domain-containing protein [Sphingobium bisphenolivorans]